ncbi:hypothetical protein PPYR_06460 [Photinus pyralis]|uniref:Acyltransferase n=2 Tax=Photinus pyralis TaxID=7054 RepID=A0A5N4ATQ0_PHOPY|nr:2-acylglycerol O-acyltransferase 1-like [Photinus pyralis]KAB0800721.1 hypothetical protein PPYR_06460 [Photinus pyralis]
MDNATSYFRKVPEKIYVAMPLFSMWFGSVLSAAVLVYVAFFTYVWPLLLVYIVWIYTIDKDTCDRGGRSNTWLRICYCFPRGLNYFPMKFINVAKAPLNAKRNYLFCCFPHGVMPLGVAGAFLTDYGGFDECFPNHIRRLATLRHFFSIPFYREYLLSAGQCSASENSLNYMLSYPGGGNIVGLTVGGAEEALYAKPGNYYVVLKKRKGFIRVALRNGSPLVPVFSFGVIDIYDQMSNPYLKRLQNYVKSVTGVALILPIGCGFLQDWFGILPKSRPITTIVGDPIEVSRIENPSQNQIEDLHSRFVEQLEKLFNDHKHSYVRDADNVKLIIV